MSSHRISRLRSVVGPIGLVTAYLLTPAESRAEYATAPSLSGPTGSFHSSWSRPKPGGRIFGLVLARTLFGVARGPRTC